MKKYILTAVLIGVGGLAQAQNTSTLGFSREESYVAPRGVVVPYLGASGGYTGYDDIEAVEGTPSNIKLLGSWYLEAPVVIDLGYGVNNQQFSQVGPAQNKAETGGILEVAARYRWENRWQAGVVANQLYEQGLQLTADQADAHFVGLQALREFNITPAWLGRVGARAQALTNNTNGQVYQYMIDLQIGWNPVAYKASVAENKYEPSQQEDEQSLVLQDEMDANSVVNVANEPMDQSPAMTTTRAALLPSEAEVTSTSTFLFPTARASLQAEDRQKLERVAEVLNQNSELFEKVEVRGYADPTGPQAINDRLSQRRAEHVGNLLKRAGLEDSKVVAVGQGVESSGNPEEDRRAEIVFQGVKDEAKLREALSTIE